MRDREHGEPPGPPEEVTVKLRSKGADESPRQREGVRTSGRKAEWETRKSLPASSTAGPSMPLLLGIQ